MSSPSSALPAAKAAEMVASNRMISRKEEEVRKFIGASVAVGALAGYFFVHRDYAWLSVGLSAGAGIYQTGSCSQ